jgi:hypothetical protein
MNENFKSLIDQAKGIAQDQGLSWTMQLDEVGRAVAGQEWNLRQVTGDGKPQKCVLRSFQQFEDAQQELVRRNLLDANAAGSLPVSEAWQDLIKAHTLDHVLVKKKSLSFAQSAAMAWRFLATVARKEPWDVDADDVQLACAISDLCQSTGARSINIMALVRNFVDVLHLFNACPMASLVTTPRNAMKGRAKFTEKTEALSKELAHRKDAEKLPERKAFWQLVNIIYTMQPTSSVDFLRFSMLKLLLLTALRVGEVVHIPFDWRRTRSYVDEAGKPAGEKGGISEAVLIRHYAEKQQEPYLFEESMFVPPMFQEDIEQIFADVIRLTAPLRATLKAQFETGRVFSQYEPSQLVDALQMYVHLTGNPVWAAPPYPPELTQCLARYRKSFDQAEMAQIADIQKSCSFVAAAVSRYFSQENRGQGLVLRDRDGNPDTGRGVRGKFLLVSDVEAFVAKNAPTKLSDLEPLKLNSGGHLAPWEMLFLMPKRAVAEGRGNSVLDLTSTFSVGIIDQVSLLVALGGPESGTQYSLFESYGQTEEERNFSLTTHQLRHLQDTELFRVGVADTVISKRHNRKSVAQSYVYDHRSLAEKMSAVELPDDWVATLGGSNAVTIAKMVYSGKANGPIVREFKRIQAEEGDQAALHFLMAEADGFHATPYGTCLASFAVDPCPKHLECFADCRHLSATDLPEHRTNLVVLHGRLAVALAHALAKPEGAVGRVNQIAHAEKRLAGVEKLLATASGELVFPDGVDLSKTNKNESILDGT